MTPPISRSFAPLGELLERLGRRLRASTSGGRLGGTALGQRLAWHVTARLGGYEPARRARLAARRTLYQGATSAEKLSLLTLVWNTDPAHLRALADSIFMQYGAPPFEWLIHDNASSDPGTRAGLAELARHPAVKLERADRNLGIVGGLRRCLERATGRYVLPIDHDDYLYPDALRIVGWHLTRHRGAGVLYSDEDKLYGDRHCRPYFKPDWDPVLFVNHCYTAHLGAFERRRALELGVWSDTTVEGCHDWDAVMRFWRAGEQPLHVPEVLYGWRMHRGSTSADPHAKDFVATSQRALLGRLIAGQNHPERYALEPNPLFPGTPNWHIRRLPGAPRPIATIVLGDPANAAVAAWRDGSSYPQQRWQSLAHGAPLEHLAELARVAAREGALVRLLSDAVAPLPPVDDASALWEAVGLFELFADTAMVGGRIVGSGGRISAAGAYFGYGDGCDCPDVGRRLEDPGYQAQMWLQRSVGAVSSALAVIDPACLIETLTAEPAAPLSLAYLGAWCGATARRAGRRVIYTPFLAGRAGRDGDLVRDTERAAFRDRHRDLLADDPLLSPRLDRAAGTRYRAVT